MNVSVKSFLLANETCSTKCRSKLHRNSCFAAVTQNVVDEELVKAFLTSFCQNFWRHVDEGGRTLVHWAASCGKPGLLEWLLEKFYQNIDLNSRDTESGYTPLHRAFLYGQIYCAQILLKYDASKKLLDFEGLTPLDVLQRNSLVTHFSLNEPTEIYAAGENVYNNLGLAIPVQKFVHEPVDFFCRQNINIKQVAMSNYHTIFVAGDGRVFTCGHGSGGRLGHGDEKAQVLPRRVEHVPECRTAAVSNSHTIVVTNDGDAYSWGDNSKAVLGLGPGCTKELSPKQIVLPKNFKGSSNFVGCAACSTFSVLWAEDLLCTFGQNHGQMGHTKHDPSVIPFPKQVSVMATKNVDHVVCCEAATALIAKKGDIYLLQHYDAKKIISRLLDLKSAHISTGGPDNRIRLLLLTTGGKLLQWRDGDSEARRTIFAGIPRLIYPVQVSVNNAGLFLVSPNGHAYSGTYTAHVPVPPAAKPKTIQSPTSPTSKGSSKFPSSPPSSKGSPKKTRDREPAQSGKVFPFRETGHFLEAAECYHVAVAQLPNVHRAIWAACSPDARNSFVLQQHTLVNLTELPTLSDSDTTKDFLRLLTEVDMDDSIHDVVISCNGASFPAHKFILASRSSYFARNMSTGLDKILITNIDPAVFDQCLKYIYTDDCEVLKIPWKGFPNWKPSKSVKDPLSLVVQAAKQLGIEGLSKKLEVISWNVAKMETKYESRRKVFTPKFRLDRNAFPELQDASLVCSDGVELRCHHCVLCARVEYFRCMFSSSWVNNARQTHPINVDSLTATNLLRYIYQDELPTSKDQSLVPLDEDPLNHLCKLIVIADEWLLNRLRQICEMKLCDLISLRNVCELLEFSQVCNADQLKKSCLQFACLNMPAIVESNSLRLLSDSSLLSLERFYKQMHPSVLARTIRPFTSVSSEDLEMAYVTLQSLGITADECADELLHQSSDWKGQKKKVQTKKHSDSKPDIEPEPTVEELQIDDESKKLLEVEELKKKQAWKMETLPSKLEEATSIESRTKTRHRITPWVLEKVVDVGGGDGRNCSEDQTAMISLKEVMAMEEKLAAAAEMKKTKLKLLSTSPMSVNSGFKKTHPGWNIQPKAVSCSPEESFPESPPSESLSKIILDEEQSLLNRREVLNKPLKLIQCEELALQQLLVAYNADNNFDELITAERYFVDRVAEPSWQAHC